VTNPRSNTRSVLGVITVVVAAVVIVALVQNVLLSVFLPRLTRMTTDFSPSYLQHKLEAMAAAPPQIVFLGDSAIWGYGLPANETAVALLTQRGCSCVNLSFKAGSPANDYALARLFALYGVHPKLVVIEINQRALNPADPSYKSLHPAIASLAGPLFTPEDRAALGQPAPATGLVAQLDRALSATWLIYAMRADLRALLLGDVDALSKKKPTADQFLGTYDLTPLDEKNIGVGYLEKTVDLLKAQGIPVVAFMTPTNHELLHDYIDDPAYGANDRYLKRLLEKRGARVIDLDRAFPTVDFLDNAHLTPPGQERLAAIFTREILDGLPNP
jgi:hypothetical protein